MTLLNPPLGNGFTLTPRNHRAVTLERQAVGTVSYRVAAGDNSDNIGESSGNIVSPSHVAPANNRPVVQRARLCSSRRHVHNIAQTRRNIGLAVLLLRPGRHGSVGLTAKLN